MRLKLYKGGVYVIGRDSPHSLYDQELVTFEEGAVAYDHHDAGGFIKLNALRLRTLAKRRQRAENSLLPLAGEGGAYAGRARLLSRRPTETSTCGTDAPSSGPSGRLLPREREKSVRLKPVSNPRTAPSSRR